MEPQPDVNISGGGGILRRCILVNQLDSHSDPLLYFIASC